MSKKLDEIFESYRQDEDIFGDVNKLKQEIFDYFESLVPGKLKINSDKDCGKLSKYGYNDCVNNIKAIIKKEREE